MAKRPNETRYFDTLNGTKPTSRGFPKGESGSIDGASKAIARGYVRKAQGVSRESGEVLWTVKAGRKLPGVNFIPPEVHKGDPDAKPVRETKSFQESPK